MDRLTVREAIFTAPDLHHWEEAPGGAPATCATILFGAHALAHILEDPEAVVRALQGAHALLELHHVARFGEIAFLVSVA